MKIKTLSHSGWVTGVVYQLCRFPQMDSESICHTWKKSSVSLCQQKCLLFPDKFVHKGVKQDGLNRLSYYIEQAKPIAGTWGRWLFIYSEHWMSEVGAGYPGPGLALGQFSLGERHKGNSVPSLCTQDLSGRKCAQAQGYESFKDCIMRVICW